MLNELNNNNSSRMFSTDHIFTWQKKDPNSFWKIWSLESHVVMQSWNLEVSTNSSLNCYMALMVKEICLLKLPPILSRLRGVMTRTKPVRYFSLNSSPNKSVMCWSLSLLIREVIFENIFYFGTLDEGFLFALLRTCLPHLELGFAV